MLDRTKSQALPAAPGVGYKAQHYTALTTDPGCVGWLETKVSYKLEKDR